MTSSVAQTTGLVDGNNTSTSSYVPSSYAELATLIQDCRDAVDRGFAGQADLLTKLLLDQQEQRAAQDNFIQESRLYRSREKRSLGSQISPNGGTSPSNRKSLRISTTSANAFGNSSCQSPSLSPAGTPVPGFPALSVSAASLPNGNGSGSGNGSGNGSGSANSIGDRTRTGGRKETSVSVGTAAQVGNAVDLGASTGGAPIVGGRPSKAAASGGLSPQNQRGSFGFHSHYSSEDVSTTKGNDLPDGASKKKSMSYSPSVITADNRKAASSGDLGSETPSCRRLPTTSREKSSASSRASPASGSTHHRYSDMMLARPQGFEREKGFLHYCAVRVLHSKRFDYLMGMIILINCISIGLEIQLTLDSDDKVKIISEMEHVFLSVYILEIIGRLLANGRVCWKQGWFLFDFFLVMMGAMTNWILIPFITGSVDAGARLMEQILIVRILRLLRLVRALRMLEQFKGLWRLVQGLLNSVRTMLSTVLLMVFTLYVFACIGIELIMKDDQLAEHPDIAPILNTYFSSIPRLMLTLVQFATTDSIAAVYSPLVYENPYLALYFMPLVLLISITMMNLVTAILVEDAISSARMDADMEQAYTRKRLKYLIPEIKAVFHSMDTSGDGSLSLDELESKIAELQENKQMLPREVRAILDPDKVADLEAIFDFLDGDGSRTISEEEFVEGICQLAFTHVPIETTQMLQMLKQQRFRFDQLLEVVQDVLNVVPIDQLGQFLGTSSNRLSLEDGTGQPLWSPTQAPEIRRLSNRQTSSDEEVGPDAITGHLNWRLTKV